MTLRIGTRPSALAMAQAGTITERLRSAGHPAELVTVTTSGDRSAASAAVTYSSPAWKPPRSGRRIRGVPTSQFPASSNGQIPVSGSPEVALTMPTQDGRNTHPSACGNRPADDVPMEGHLQHEQLAPVSYGG
jgi:hypothetical protein